MKKWFDKLNVYYKCCFLSTIFLLFSALALIPLYFIGWKEIPLGLALGLVFGIISNFILGYFENRKKEGYMLFIVISSFRYFLFALMLIMLALCYYVWDVKIFNIIVCAGGYLVNTIFFAVMYSKNKKEEK